MCRERHTAKSTATLTVSDLPHHGARSLPLTTTDSLTQTLTESLPPVGCAALATERACYANISCYWSLQFAGCMNVTFQSRLRDFAMDGVQLPVEAAPRAPVAVTLYGAAQLRWATLLLLREPGEDEEPLLAPCPPIGDAAWLRGNPDAANATLWRSRYVFTFAMPNITADGGVRRVCVTFNNGSASQPTQRVPSDPGCAFTVTVR